MKHLMRQFCPNNVYKEIVFSIDSPEKKTLYQQSLHSSWGVEEASYTMLFQPVEPVESDIKMLKFDFVYICRRIVGYNPD